ncbi:MAG TPA: type IX secretion system outer membrane channel protein PorV [Bacteroidota bacterium]|nr:type IX secretion system outer membrane channel protein PorV [Bacteroidota bacterium]
MRYAFRKQTMIWLGILMAAVVSIIPQMAQAQGESAVPFLLIAPNARNDAMGESGAGISDDASAVFWNPAGLAFQRGQEISLTHSNWLPQFQQSDLFYDYFVYKNYMPDIDGTVSASITYLNLGEFAITTTSPDVIGTFKAYEVAITAGYATTLTSELGLGLNLRYIRSVLAPYNVQGQGREGIASAPAFDVSVLWKPTNLAGMGDMLTIGANLQNLGPKMTYIDEAQADPLPTNIRLGFGIKAIKSDFNNLTVNIDFDRLLVRRYPSAIDSSYIDLQTGDTVFTYSDPRVDNLPKSLVTAWGDGGLRKVDISGGIEYWYGAPKLLALRFGYFYEDPNYGNRKFMTFGAGIRYDMYGFDFSYLSAIEENSPLANTLRFSLQIAWGQPSTETTTQQ